MSNPHKVTVAEHDDWRQSLAASSGGEEFDDFDPLILDHPPGLRKEGEISKLDAIFDELERRGA